MSQTTNKHCLEVCQQLTEEHRKTELLLDALESCLDAFECGPVPAETRIEMDEILGILRKDLDIHFACEEQCLFPVLSRYHPMVLMEVEHEELIELRNQLEKAYRDSEASPDINNTVWSIGYQFTTYLREHIAREDKGIFPQAEHELSQAEKQTAVDEMAALRKRSQTETIAPIIRAPKDYQKIEMDLGPDQSKPIEILKLLEKPDLTLKQINLKADKSLASHWSPKQVFLLCISGTAEFTANDQTEILSAGVGVLMSPRLLHAVKARTDCQFLLLALNPEEPSKPCQNRCHHES